MALHPDKVRELSKELSHEDEWNRKQANRPKLLGYYFYNIPFDDRDTAESYGIKQLKSGKWGMPIYDKSGASTAYRKRLADDAYGKGKWWEPNMKKIKEDVPTNMAITQVNKDKVTVSSTDQAGMKSTNEVPASAFSRNEQGKLEVNKQQLAKLPGTITGQKPTIGQTPGSQQQQAPKAGEKIQLASVDAELDGIRKNAGL